MSQHKASYHFTRLKHKYVWLRGTEILLWSAAIGLLSFYLINLFTISLLISITIGCLMGCVAAVLGSRYVGIFHIQEKELARYLNRRYPELEESVDLLLQRDVDLSSLQQLQKVKTVQRFKQLYPAIKLPHHIWRATSVFAFSIILSAFLTSFSQKYKADAANKTGSKLTVVSEKNLPASIKSSVITITPPSYTGLRPDMSDDFNIQIPEGSTVRWDIRFEGEVLHPKIIFSASDSISISKTGDNFSVNRSFTSTGFYQLAWQNSDTVTQRSAYYKITIIQDHPPIISIENPNQFVTLTNTDNLKVNLSTTLADDYGLTHANIIATVARGSGEAIKFREEKLNFDAPQKISGRKINATRLIDLVKLKLQPGDELYFYIEATDNKTPLPNKSRTETYFIALQDTASVTTSLDASLGVDIMPEYFRSQRQIIIDSEKLLADKNRINQQTFNLRSNELGHDQKVLRLRYGEFLGEEFESSIGPSSTSSTLENHDEDVAEKFGHAHDTDNEHNLVDEKNNSHHHTESAPNQKKDPLKEFVHAHDGTEEATFFNQSIRTKLKAAITIMWDAELYLRLNQPGKSLPYQYKALKLLKEISQDSRIYVHRTGFDPPPLKEEKRLTGDLSEINSSASTTLGESNQEFPAVRASIPVIEKLIREDSIIISTAIKDLLTRAGQELARQELKQPGRYLETLSWLQMITQQNIPQDETKKILMKIRTSFWKMLPPKVTSPQARSGVIHDLDRQFLNSLEASKQIH